VAVPNKARHCSCAGPLTRGRAARSPAVVRQARDGVPPPARRHGRAARLLCVRQRAPGRADDVGLAAAPPAPARRRLPLAVRQRRRSEAGSSPPSIEAAGRRAPVRRGCDACACPPRRRARAQHRGLREPRPDRRGPGPAAATVRARRPHAGDPRHGESDVPARTRRGAGAGHGVEQADWGTIARAILAHTAAGDGGR
jgi:hypothetical protein